jgi:hypothetical protein
LRQGNLCGAGKQQGNNKHTCVASREMARYNVVKHFKSPHLDDALFIRRKRKPGAVVNRCTN